MAELLRRPLLKALLFSAALALALPVYSFSNRGIQGELCSAVAAVESGLRVARSAAAMEGTVHFVVFSSWNDKGWIEIHRDADRDGFYDGDGDRTTTDADSLVNRGSIDLPSGLVFDWGTPGWVAISPTGLLKYLPGHPSRFGCDGFSCPKKHICLGFDVGIRQGGRPNWACINLSQARGRIETHFLLLQESTRPSILEELRDLLKRVGLYP